MKKGGEEERRERARDHIELFVRCAFGFEKEIRPSLSLSFPFLRQRAVLFFSLSLFFRRGEELLTRTRRVKQKKAKKEEEKKEKKVDDDDDSKEE